MTYEEAITLLIATMAGASGLGYLRARLRKPEPIVNHYGRSLRKKRMLKKNTKNT